MKANYHTHSRWCRHGSGEIEDYVREALAAGLEELAITEHVPRATGFSWIPFESLDAFDADLNRVIAQYSDRIRLIKGFECEYFPEEMDYYRRLREERGYRLMILGQHNFGPERKSSFTEKSGADLLTYADEVAAGLSTGFFDYLAHPDCALEKCSEPWDALCEEAFHRIFSRCETMDIPVEINCGGLRSHRRYPCEDVFRFSKAYRLRYFIGSDAHHPQDLVDWAVAEAEDFARRLDLPVTEYLDLSACRG